MPSRHSPRCDTRRAHRREECARESIHAHTHTHGNAMYECHSTSRSSGGIMSILFSTIIALSVVISPITTHSREACHNHSSASSDGVVRTVEDSSVRRSRGGSTFPRRRRRRPRSTSKRGLRGDEPGGARRSERRWCRDVQASTVCGRAHGGGGLFLPLLLDAFLI